MTARKFESIFPADVMSKRDRVLATLNHEPVDRVAILEQLSYNPAVIADWTGKDVHGFEYTEDDICTTIRRTLDLTMPPVPPRGRSTRTTADGLVMQDDEWTSWRVSKPFDDEHGARDWLCAKTERGRVVRGNDAERIQEQRDSLLALQAKVGDTVIMPYSQTGFCNVFDSMGLETFTFFSLDYPEVFADHLEVSVTRELERIHALADPELFPVVLIAEDFATKHGPIFRPDFLQEYHFPRIRQLADAWHEHGVKVMYHSDGNWRGVIPQLIDTGVDGFYCLEKNCGMDAVEFKNSWPELVWSGGVDGVDLLERGTPAEVRDEVHRQITEVRALQTGGMILASSSEINPPIPAANFRAMIEAGGEVWNADFRYTSC